MHYVPSKLVWWYLQGPPNLFDLAFMRKTINIERKNLVYGLSALAFTARLSYLPRAVPISVAKSKIKWLNIEQKTIPIMNLDTYQNPVYVKLVDEMYINTSISYLRGDMESVLYGLLRINSNCQLYKECTAKVEEFINGNNVNLTNIKSFLLATIFLDQNLKLKEIKRVLSDLITSTVYPIGEKAHIFYLIQSSKKFEDESIALNQFILRQSEELKRRNRLNVLVQGTFSLTSNHFKADYEKFLEGKLTTDAIIKSASELVPIYKACLHLRKNFPDYLTLYSSKIEGLIQKLSKINQSPEIWFAISESEKIINSNLGKDIDATILTLLKENKIEWAQRIKEIQNDSVTISINQQFGLTRMSNYDIFYATELLSAEGRNLVVTIPAEKKEEYLNFLHGSNLATDRQSIVRLVIFFLITELLIAMNTMSSIDLLNNYINEAVQISLKPKSCYQ